MSKLTKQNVGGVDYTTVGCALTATCVSAASDYIKVATLSDGDVISDGMFIRCLFAHENTAGSAPDVLTIYSSDQVNYYSDDQLTVPFTLAPEGCYSVEYTGTGNAYNYISWVCLSVGNVTAMITLPSTGVAGGTLWDAQSNVVLLYSDGKFRLMNVGVSRADIPSSNPVSVRGAQNAAHYSTLVTGDANNIVKTGFYTGYNLANAPTIGWLGYIVATLNNNASFLTQIAVQDNNVWIRRKQESWSAWKVVMNNDTAMSFAYSSDRNIVAKWVRQGNIVQMQISVVDYTIMTPGTYTIDGVPKIVLGTTAGGIRLNWGYDTLGYVILEYPAPTQLIIVTSANAAPFTATFTYICAD